MSDTPLSPTALIAQRFQELIAGPQTHLAPNLVRLFAFFAHVHKETRTRRTQKRKRSAANAPKGQKRSNFIEFYKNRRFSRQTGPSLRKKSPLQTEGRLGISSAVCCRDYLGADESQGHRFAITTSATMAAIGLKE
jgi:hypothetical protein